MKTSISICLTAWMLWACLTGLAQAQFDDRAFGKLAQNDPKGFLRVASVYLTFEGDKAGDLPTVEAGGETRFPFKVWDGLYLQVTTETGENGVTGYMFSFSKDEADQTALASEEAGGLPTLREVAAADFRTENNSAPRPIHPGPGTSKDRGPFRIVSYPAFDAEIRILEFSLRDAMVGKKPYFKTLSCLVTIKEKEAKKAEK